LGDVEGRLIAAILTIVGADRRAGSEPHILGEFVGSAFVGRVRCARMPGL
jgi:hypothetical protein